MRPCRGCRCRIGHTEGCPVAEARWAGKDVSRWVQWSALAAVAVIVACTVIILIVTTRGTP
jgi:hypothetical protein